LLRADEDRRARVFPEEPVPQVCGDDPRLVAAAAEVVGKFPYSSTRRTRPAAVVAKPDNVTATRRRQYRSHACLEAMNPMTCREPARSTPQRQSRHAAFRRPRHHHPRAQRGTQTMPGTPAPERRPHVPVPRPSAPVTSTSGSETRDTFATTSSMPPATSGSRDPTARSIIAWHNNAQVAMKRQRSDHSVLQHFSMTCP
jgi:hypothetical protein